LKTAQYELAIGLMAKSWGCPIITILGQFLGDQTARSPPTVAMLQTCFLYSIKAQL